MQVTISKLITEKLKCHSILTENLERFLRLFELEMQWQLCWTDPTALFGARLLALSWWPKQDIVVGTDLSSHTVDEPYEKLYRYFYVAFSLC